MIIGIGTKKINTKHEYKKCSKIQPKAQVRIRESGFHSKKCHHKSGRSIQESPAEKMKLCPIFEEIFTVIGCQNKLAKLKPYESCPPAVINK
jgi:hypothetical protein